MRRITKKVRDEAAPTLVCSRCGAPVHRSWDHLDIGEHGERWTCDARTKAADDLQVRAFVRGPSQAARLAA